MYIIAKYVMSHKNLLVAIGHCLQKKLLVFNFEIYYKLLMLIFLKTSRPEYNVKIVLVSKATGHQ